MTKTIYILRNTPEQLSVIQDAKLPVCCNLPMTHGSIRRLNDKCFLLAFSFQLLYIILELCALSWEDPGFGDEAIFLRLTFNHSKEKNRVLKLSKMKSKVNVPWLEDSCNQSCI